MEEHNIPNQAFLMTCLEMNKVEALASMAPWVDIDVRTEFYEGQTPLGDVVFLLIDTMSGRKEIFEKHIRMKRNVRLMIETRVGSDLGKIFTLDPRKPSHIKYWEENWFPDDKAEVSKCGSTISVGPTGDIISGYAVWQFMNWMLNKESLEGLHHDLTLATRGELVALTNSVK